MIAMRQRLPGFTLVELLIVVAVIGLLATVGITNFASSQVRARDVEREGDVKALSQALDLYVLNNNAYPLTIDTTTFGTSVSKNIFKGPGETSANSLINMNNNSFMSIPAGTKRSSYIYLPFINGPSSGVSDASCGTISVAGVPVACDSFAVAYYNEQNSQWRWVTSKKYPPPESRLTQLRAALASSGL